jgi:hypothetical protein
MATSAPTPLTKPVPPKPAPLRLNARKADIARIEVVHMDVLISLKSGRKILVPDGVNTALSSEDFVLVFSDNEEIT